MIDETLTRLIIRVGTYNGKSADTSRIASIAGNPEVPDMLILQEVRCKESCRYLSDSLGLPYWVFSFYPAGFDDGLAVISRYPVKILKSFRFNRYGALAVEAKVTKCDLKARSAFKIWCHGFHRTRCGNAFQCFKK